MQSTSTLIASNNAAQFKTRPTSRQKKRKCQNNKNSSKYNTAREVFCTQPPNEADSCGAVQMRQFSVENAVPTKGTH